jgi:glycosyltransferase involved in cell wall biosynthesis
VAHKGLDVLVKGYARYVRSAPHLETELIVAGPDFRSGRAELMALATAHIPDGGVRFPGPVFGDDKDALMSSAYLFVHTSRWEGMPYAVLEALAQGCPVLVTPATNLGGFVDEFGAGLVVQGTVGAISDGLATVLEMPTDRYEAMCSGALRLAAQRFGWPTVASQMSAAYRNILA